VQTHKNAKRNDNNFSVIFCRQKNLGKDGASLYKRITAYSKHASF